jgi:cation diffusion facilitator family transporter
MESGAAGGREKQRAAAFSVLSNTVLTFGKLAAYLVTASVSVLSEALHSGLDLVAALMAFFAVRQARQPADVEHRFGHGKFESISGFVEGILILVAVALILYRAVDRIVTGTSEVREPLLGIAVMGVSAVVNVLVSRLLFRVARRTDSVALEADAWHLRTDVWTSAGVFAGLSIIAVGSKISPALRELHHLDPIIAIGVALVIARAAWDITRRSWDHLVDRALPAEEVAQIERLIQEHYPTIAAYHRLRTRKSGPQRQIDVHVVVAGDMPVAEAHQICDDLEGDLREMFPGSEALIHVEPEVAHEQG